LDIRIERGIFPKPTFVDDTGIQYVRYFDESWVSIAQAILKNAPNTVPKKTPSEEQI